MVTLMTLGDNYGTRRRCDARCHNAGGPTCKCICGGRYHGAGRRGPGQGSLQERIAQTSAQFLNWMQASGAEVGPLRELCGARPLPLPI